MFIKVPLITSDLISRISFEICITRSPVIYMDNTYGLIDKHWKKPGAKYTALSNTC